MKRSIRSISIDGVEKTGKTSVFQQLRSFLKEKKEEVVFFDETTKESLQKQMQELDGGKGVILRQNSILSLFYNKFKEFEGVANVEELYRELIDIERKINWKHGCVHLFLIPTNKSVIKDRFEGGEPYYLNNLIDFFKNINQYQIVQGLDVRLVFFDENDFIFDITDKVVKVLEEYNI